MSEAPVNGHAANGVNGHANAVPAPPRPSKDEFFALFRGRFLVFLTEAWCARKEQPTQLGMLMDRHRVELQRLMGDVYDALVPPPKLNVTLAPRKEKP